MSVVVFLGVVPNRDETSRFFSSFILAQNAVIHSVANTFGIPCIPILGETQDKTKTKNHSGNSDRNQTCSYSHSLETISSFDMFDTLHNSDSSISSFEAPSIEKRYFAHNINSPHKLHFENNITRNEITPSSTQVYNNNITSNNNKSAMMCYPTIINDNPWWEEQESCKDHHAVPVPVQEGETPVVAAEWRDEREGDVSSSVNYGQDNDNDSSRMNPLSLTQESLFTNVHGSGEEDRYISRGYNDDGPRFDIDNAGKGREKDYCDNGINSNDEDKADEDDDNSSIISSSSSAVFEFFEDVSMMTDEYASVMSDESSLGEDDVFMNEYDDEEEEDEDCIRYCIFEISDDASLLIEATKDDKEKDDDVELFSPLENDMWEDHRHQQQEEVIEGSTMIDEESKTKISMASKDQVLLDFLFGFCSDKGFSSDDALRWA